MNKIFFFFAVSCRSTLWETFPPGPRRGREKSCKQSKQKCSAAGGGWGLWIGVIHSSVIPFLFTGLYPPGDILVQDTCLQRFTAVFSILSAGTCPV
ncbi:hypothetical protein K0H02_19535 [Bacteroides fragilis]|nr:hypothetical protein [Bacteroides fragilis]